MFGKCCLYLPYETSRLAVESGQRTEDLEECIPPATMQVVDGGADLGKRHFAMVGESSPSPGGTESGVKCVPRVGLPAHGMEGSLS